MAKPISQKEFEVRISQKYPNEFFKIIKYTNMSSPLEIQCLKCNKILYSPQAKNFLAKNKIAGCSECNGLRAKNSLNLKKLQLKYEIIKQERDNSGKLWYTCKCRMCGRISTHLLVSFLENTCRCEGSGNRWTEQEFKKKLKEEFDDEYTLISDFTNVNNKSLFKHSCGFIWSTTPAHILYNKNKCPKCSRKQSKGEKFIEDYLKKIKMPYEKEKFLKNSLQRFDFYCEFQNKKYAIEYNGEQHYKYNPFFHGGKISIFEAYQKRDQKKAQFCKENNIILITIPYTMAKEEIIAYLNNFFSSSTTSSMNVASSEAK